jgi:hypothetical protein
VAQKKHPLEVFRQTRNMSSRPMTHSAPAAQAARQRTATNAASAQKKPPLRGRTLRFTGDAVLVVCGLNVLLLAAMFWVGYVNGKRAARAELRLSTAVPGGGTADDPRLRSDAEAKSEWDRPAPGGEIAGNAKTETAPDKTGEAGKAAVSGAGARSGADGSASPQTQAPPAAATTSVAPSPAPSNEPAATEKKWVVQAVCYDMGKQLLAESWRDTLVREKFENVELYKLGKDRPMIGLCVGEANNKQDLEGVLKRVQQFTSRNDERPFSGAVITQLAVTRR